MGWLIFSTMFGGAVIVVLGNLALSRRHHFALDNADLSRGIISRSSVVSTMWISCPWYFRTKFRYWSRLQPIVWERAPGIGIIAAL